MHFDLAKTSRDCIVCNYPNGEDKSERYDTFERCEVDPCLYKLVKGNEVIYVACYVDDLIMASTSDSLRTSFMADLKRVFEVKDTGDLTWILGAAITQDIENGTVSIDQSLYIEDMMKTMLGRLPATSSAKAKEAGKKEATNASSVSKRGMFIQIPGAV